MRSPGAPRANRRGSLRSAQKLHASESQPTADALTRNLSALDSFELARALIFVRYLPDGESAGKVAEPFLRDLDREPQRMSKALRLQVSRSTSRFSLSVPRLRTPPCSAGICRARVQNLSAASASVTLARDFRGEHTSPCSPRLRPLDFAVTTPPQDPLIFHITHVENLAGILHEGG